jgi:hypothetical protein
MADPKPIKIVVMAQNLGNGLFASYEDDFAVGVKNLLHHF